MSANFPASGGHRAPFFDAMTRSAMNGGGRLADGRYPTTYKSTSGSLGSGSAQVPNMGPRSRNLLRNLGSPTNNMVHSDVDHSNTPLAITTIFDPSATQGQTTFHLGQPLFLMRKKKPARSNSVSGASDINMTNVIVTAAMLAGMWESAYLESASTIRDGLKFRGTETGPAGYSGRTRKVSKRVDSTNKDDDPSWMTTEADVLEKITPLGLFFTHGPGNANTAGTTPWSPASVHPDLSYLVYGRIDHVPNVFGANRNELGWVGLIVSKKQFLHTGKDVVDQTRAPLSFSVWNSPQCRWPTIENNTDSLDRVLARHGKEQMVPDAAALGFGPLSFLSDPYMDRKSAVDEDYLNRPLAYLDTVVQRDNRRNGIPTWYWMYRTGIFQYTGQVAATEARDGALNVGELDAALLDDDSFKDLSTWARVALEM